MLLWLWRCNLRSLTCICGRLRIEKWKTCFARLVYKIVAYMGSKLENLDTVAYTLFCCASMPTSCPAANISACSGDSHINAVLQPVASSCSPDTAVCSNNNKDRRCFYLFWVETHTQVTYSAVLVYVTFSLQLCWRQSSSRYRLSAQKEPLVCCISVCLWTLIFCT